MFNTEAWADKIYHHIVEHIGESCEMKNSFQECDTLKKSKAVLKEITIMKSSFKFLTN